MLSTTKPLLSLCAADIMSKNIVMIPREMSLQGAARLLSRAGVSGAPVVDADGSCIGVVSTTDFMHWIERDQPHAGAQRGGPAMCLAWQMPESEQEPFSCVGDCMTRDPVLVSPGTRIGELARMMMDAHIHRLIVADMSTQRPLGIVSSMDILAVLARVDQMHTAAGQAEGLISAAI